ncbi:unnamed protein product [Effrenium voratum]|nr:unnamed protein product [Effrenium voratum]
MLSPFLSFDGPVADQLYVIGGRDNNQEPLDVVEMFDAWNGRWVQCPHMLARRAGCAAAALPNGRLIVCGGYDEQGIVRGVLDSCEVFDPVGQVWAKAGADLLRARWGHGCSVLGSLVYAVGGCALLAGSLVGEELMETLRSCETYDVTTNEWRPAPTLNVARAGARVVAIAGGKLAAVGGCDDVFGRAEMLASVEILTQECGGWVLLDTQLGVPRTTAAAVALDAERILVMGGAPSLSSAEVYHVQRKAEEPEQGDGCQAGLEALQIQDMAEGISTVTDATNGYGTLRTCDSDMCDMCDMRGLWLSRRHARALRNHTCDASAWGGFAGSPAGTARDRPRQVLRAEATVVSPFGASQELVELPDVRGFAICLADCFALQEAKPKEPEVKDTEEIENEKPKLPLSWDNVQEADCGWAERHVKHVLLKCSPHPQRIGVRCEVLDELRPYLKSDGGDCKISSIDGGVVSLELIGACSSCSASSVTMKMGIEKTLKERIPEISEVVAVTPDQEPLSEEGIEEVLNGIRPFLSVSGGSIEIFELNDKDSEDQKVVLKMVGPPLKSMAVRVEVQNRIKRKYPAVQDVSIVGEDGKPPSSA